tara:strand:- start:9766 stop:9969 length:204 start_codon:yes stop_codon:yes gene_type:complete
MQKQAQDYNERINQLTNEYTLWGIKNGFIDDDLKSADEMLMFYPNLTVDQIIWIKEFQNQWEILEDG